ncbi:MAG: hypothetical protein NVSMB32_06460 [Actinomycetota bacterium]
MWLVLCNDDDWAAQWAGAGLAQRGLAPLELVTASSLARARRWAHYVTDNGCAVEITLDDGRSIDSRQVQGVLNRLVSVWNAWTTSAAPGDRDYAGHEFYAFVVSWLNCLPGPVLNRPSFMGPGGRWRHDAEWTLLASRAGLPTAPYLMPGRPAPAGDKRPVPQRCVVVLGEEVFGTPPGGSLAEGCRRLGKLAQTELLGIEFEERAGEPGAGAAWRFRTATPRPDLQVAGAPLLDALVRHFSLAGCAAR